MRFMKLQFITYAYLFQSRILVYCGRMQRARYLDNNDHRQSPRTSFGGDPRGHKDYHSMNDPSSLELFTKSHHAMTHLACNHAYAWHIWMHGRGERDIEEGDTYISLHCYKQKKKAFNEKKLCLSKFLTSLLISQIIELQN